MAERKIPLRKCIGCGEMKDKRVLVRVVRNKEGEISIDLKGKKPGRGAYICNSVACLDKAQKARRLERAFSTAIDPQIYDEMRRELSEER